MQSVITADQISCAEEAGACQEALGWLRVGPRTVEEMALAHPDWVLWAVGHGFVVPAELLDACAEREPGIALEYAADCLTPERLDACAEQKPDAALGYAAHLLPPDRLGWCAEREPWLALYCAAAYLTPERLDAYAEREPYAALEYAAEYLTPERLDWCRNGAII
jgi:hypothetical protein